MNAHAIHPGPHALCPPLADDSPGPARSRAAENRASMTRAELDRELAAHHGPGMGWALACCSWDRELAEDVLHASYLKVLEGQARFGGRSSFRTWLFAVIRMTARERRRTILRRLLAFERQRGAQRTHTPAQQDLSPDAARLRDELEALPTRQREVLHLVFYGDLSIREASEVMKVSLGTARTHYERGKARLRERLGIEEERNG